MLRHRSTRTEYLDEPDLPAAALHQNLRELDTINRLLGGHAATLHGLRQLWPSPPLDEPPLVVDFGCGGGDTLLAVARWARSKSLPVKLIGLDYNPEVCAFATAATAEYPEISIRCMDFYSEEARALQPTVGLAALFTHHLSDPQNVAFLRHLAHTCSAGFVINDLHRHPVAYGSIWALARALPTSYLLKHDAPLSVARGFRLGEWKALLAHAGVPQAQVRWRWAFRWQVVYKTSTAHGPR